MHVWRRVFLLRNWNEFKWCSVDLNGTSISGEKAVATHSSTLAWQIPWTEELGRLQSMGSLGVVHTERLPFHFSLSCIGEGNGNPLQCSCLENPRDGGAWWAAVYGVAQSRTWLKWLSSSSSMFKARTHCRFQYQSSVICNQKGWASYHLPRDMYQGLAMHCWSSHLGGATGEARDLAKHPTTNKTISTTKNCPA